MGNFRIVINAVGGHGQDREKKDGEVVDFTKDGQFSPEYIAQRCIAELKRFGNSVDSAHIVHWPETESEVTDDLLTGIRTGNF